MPPASAPSASTGTGEDLAGRVDPSATVTPTDRLPGAHAAAVGLLATLVVAVGVTGPSLWTDEAATVSAATRPLGELWRMAGTLDAVHTAYYLLMHGWTALAGTSELALRAPSAVGVGLVAAGTALLGARLGGRRLGLVAAVVVVLLPRTAWAGIEARPFALATAAAVWATLLLVLAVERRRARWWLGYAVLVAVAVLLNLYLVLLVAAHAVALWPHRRRVRDVVVPWFVAAGAGGLAAAPMVVVALGQQAQLGEAGFGPLALARNVVVNQWFLGETPTVWSRSGAVEQATWSWATAWRPAAVLLALTACALVGLAVLQHVRRRPRPPVAAAWWVVPWLVVPTVVLVAWALVSSTYSPRYLTFTAPAAALALAWAVLVVRPARLRLVAAVVLVVLAVPVLVSQRTENAKSGADWREVAQLVEQRAQPGDGVWFAPRHPELPGEVRLTTRGIAVAYPDAFDGLVDVTRLRTPTEAGDLTGRSARLTADRLRDVDRLWVVRRHDYPADVRARDDAVLADAGLVEVSRWSGTLDEVVELERR